MSLGHAGADARSDSAAGHCLDGPAPKCGARRRRRPRRARSPPRHRRRRRASPRRVRSRAARQSRSRWSNRSWTCRAVDPARAAGRSRTVARAPGQPAGRGRPVRLVVARVGSPVPSGRPERRWSATAPAADAPVLRHGGRVVADLLLGHCSSSRSTPVRVLGLCAYQSVDGSPYALSVRYRNEASSGGSVRFVMV